MGGGGGLEGHKAKRAPEVRLDWAFPATLLPQFPRVKREGGGDGVSLVDHDLILIFCIPGLLTLEIWNCPVIGQKELRL